MTDSRKHKRVVLFYLTHGKRGNPGSERTVQCSNKFIGDDGEACIGGMNPIQREGTTKEIRRQSLTPYHDTIGLDGIVERCNVDKGGSMRSRLICNDVVVSLRGRTDGQDFCCI